MNQLSPRTQRILIQVACSAVLFCIAAPGPVLWLTAILVCLGGTGIYLYQYYCMREQADRRAYLLICLLWLWGSTAINLWPGEVYQCAPLHFFLLALAVVLIQVSGKLTREERWARTGAFFLPVGVLALIPYGQRDFESGCVMAFVATVLLAIDTICNLTGAAAPRTRQHPRWVRSVFIGLFSIFLLVSCLEPGLILIAAAICTIAWGGKLSDYYHTRCGMQNPIALCAMRTLLALAPLGIANYLLNLLAFLSW